MTGLSANVTSLQLMMFIRIRIIFPTAGYKDAWPVTLTPRLGNHLIFVWMANNVLPAMMELENATTLYEDESEAALISDQ